MLTADDWKYIDSMQPAAAAPEQQSLGARVGAHLRNLPDNTFAAFGETLQGIGDTLSGKPEMIREDERAGRQRTLQDQGILSPFAARAHVAPANTVTEIGTDILLGGIAPELPGLLIPGAGFTKGAKLLGSGEKLARFIGGAGTGILSGNRESNTEAGMQGLEFGLMEAAGAAVPSSRPLLKATATGLAGGGIGLAGQAVRGNDPFSKEGLTQAGIMTALPFAAEGRSLFRKTPKQGVTASQPTASEPSAIPGDWKLRQVVESPDGEFTYQNHFDTPEGPQVIGTREPVYGAPSGEAAPTSAPQSLPFNPEAPPSGYQARRLLRTPRPAVPEPGYQESNYSRPLSVEQPPSVVPETVTTETPPAPATRRDAWGSTYGIARFPEPAPAPRRMWVPPSAEGPRPAIPTPPPLTRPDISFREAVQNRSTVSLHGEPGKLSVGEDGIYFRRQGSNVEERVYGLQPDDPISSAEGMGMVRAGQRRLLQRAVEEPGPYNTQIAVGDNKGPRLKRLGSREGTVNASLLTSIGGGAAGALTGYALPGTEEEKRNRAILMGTVGAIGAGGVRLARSLRSPEAIEAAHNVQNNISQPLGQRVLGGIRRFGEKYTKAGKSSTLDTAQQRAQYASETALGDVSAAAKGAVKEYKTLDAKQQKAVAAYLHSDRGPAAKSLLSRAALPAKVQSFLDTAEGTKFTQQHTIADIMDPTRATMLRKTPGYQTQPYEAFHSPETWQPSAADFDAVIAANRSRPEYAGMSDSLIRKDLEQYTREVRAAKGDISAIPPQGASKISQSLWIKKKVLTPEIKRFLGEITDPVQRELMSVAKLAKSSENARLIKELQTMKDDAGNPMLMTRSQWDAEVTKAKAAGDNARAKFLETSFETVPEDPNLGIMSKTHANEGMMAQRQVMDAMKVGPGHQIGDWARTMFGFMSKLQSPMKASMTLYNPATHIHNLAQVPLQALTGGVAPWSIGPNLRRAYRDPAMLRRLREDGMLDAHVGSAEFDKAADNWDTLLNPSMRSKVSNAHETVKQLYGKPDQWTRAPAYINFFDEATGKLGMAEKQARAYATEMTNRYTQNYSNVAPAVGIVRNIPLINPFVSYTAEMWRIMRNLAEDVLFDPMRAKFGASQRIKSLAKLGALFTTGAAIKKGIEMLNLSDEDKRQLEAMTPHLPAYMRGKTMAGLKPDAKTGNLRQLNLNPWLPAEDTVTLAKNIWNGDMDAFFTNNPIVSARGGVTGALTELISGRDAFTGKENHGLWEAGIRPILKSSVPPLLPPGYAFKKLEQGFTRNDKGELGVTDAQGRRETPETAIMGALGVSVSQLNPRKLLERAKREQDQDISDAKSKMRKVLQSDINEEAKQEARQEYQETTRRIFQRR